MIIEEGYRPKEKLNTDKPPKFHTKDANNVEVEVEEIQKNREILAEILSYEDFLKEKFAINAVKKFYDSCQNNNIDRKNLEEIFEHIEYILSRINEKRHSYYDLKEWVCKKLGFGKPFLQ